MAAGAGAASRPHGNAVDFGVVDEVADDEIVVHIAHLLDDVQLIFQPLPVLLVGLVAG